MSGPAPKRWWRRLVSTVWTALAISLIGCAVLLGALELLLPHADHARPRLAAWLSDRLDRPVSIDHVAGQWVGRGPLLVLTGVELGSTPTSSALRLDRISIAIDSGALLSSHFEARLFEVRVDALTLVLKRGRDGRYALAAIQGDRTADGADLGWLSDLGVHLSDVRLRLIDETSGFGLTLTQAQFRLRRIGERLGLSARVPVAKDGLIELIGDLAVSAGDGVSGTVWLGVERMSWPDTGPLAMAVAAEVRVSTQLWLHLDRGQLQALSGNATVDASRDDAPLELRAEFDLHRQAQALTGQIHALSLTTGGGGEASELGQAALSVYRNGDFELDAESMDLATLAPALAALGVVDTDLWGRVESLQFQRRDGELALSAALHEIGLAHGPHAVQGLSGTIAGGLGEFVLRVDSDRLWLLPPGFESPLQLSAVAGHVGVAPGADESLVVDVDIDGLGAEGRLAVSGTITLGQAPEADLRLGIEGNQTDQIRDYLPRGRMPARTEEWLTRALVKGRVASGGCVLRGMLKNYPFREGGGRFECRADLGAATLAFDRQWPALTKGSGVLVFENQGMRIEQARGMLGRVRVERGIGLIEDLNAAVLELDLAGSADLGELLRTLAKTPVNGVAGPALALMSGSGLTQATAVVKVPMRRNEREKPSVVGSIQLADSTLGIGPWVQLANVRGRVDYSRTGVAASDVRARFRDRPVRIDVAVADRVSDPALIAQAQMDMRGEAAALCPESAACTEALSALVGEGLWEIGWQIDQDRRQRLSVRSDLRGIASRWPAPFAKPASTTMMLSLGLPVPLTDGVYLGAIEGLAQFRADLIGGQVRGAGVAFGSTTPPPARSGWWVEGVLPQIDVGAVIALPIWGRSDSDGIWPGAPPSLELRTADLRFANKSYGAASALLEFAPGRLGAAVQATEATGQLHYDYGARRLDAHFERLHVPTAVLDPNPAPSIVDPRSMPALVVTVDDFSYLDAPLGSLQLRATPVPEAGLRVDRFETRTGALTIAADGYWRGDGHASSSQFRIAIDADSTDDLLRTFGYAGRVERGALSSHFDVGWDGAPADFALERLNGTLDLTVGAGTLSTIDPGAGRIFGLLSLDAIPRRLTLDFRDLFEKGLRFDRIKGQFLLSSGQAYTEDLRIEGPVADIRISGRTGLMARDYTQQMTVYPKLGNALTLVGGLAAGPAGAAAALLVGSALGKPLSEIGQAHYDVSGPWEDPQVKPRRPPSRREANAQAGSP